MAPRAVIPLRVIGRLSLSRVEVDEVHQRGEQVADQALDADHHAEEENRLAPDLVGDARADRQEEERGARGIQISPQIFPVKFCMKDLANCP